MNKIATGLIGAAVMVPMIYLGGAFVAWNWGWVSQAANWDAFVRYMVLCAFVMVCGSGFLIGRTFGK